MSPRRNPHPRGVISSVLSMSFILLAGISLVVCSSGAGKKKQSAPVQKTGDQTAVKKRAMNGSGEPSKRDPAGGSGGACLSGDCVNGCGRYRYDTGDFYEGCFKNGLREGRGKFEYANGDRFEGAYRQDLKEGKGKYVFQEGDVFEGQFQKGERNGPGVYQFGDGRRFEGNFEEDGRRGKGKLLFENEALDCEIRDWTLHCRRESPPPQR